MSTATRRIHDDPEDSVFWYQYYRDQALDVVTHYAGETGNWDRAADMLADFFDVNSPDGDRWLESLKKRIQAHAADLVQQGVDLPFAPDRIEDPEIGSIVWVGFGRCRVVVFNGERVLELVEEIAS